MDLFLFLSWCLTIVVVVTAIWPVNTLLLALAYKVRHGSKPLPIAPGEFWLRCLFGALGLALLTGLFLGMIYFCTLKVEMPIGPVHMVFLMAYLLAGIGYLLWILALEDLVQALSVLFLYIALPGLPLLLVGRFTGLWLALREAAPWLSPTP